MGHINIEFKARCKNLEEIRNYLKNHFAEFIGQDHQIDTYFNVPNGRLKLREGNIENHLIYYERANKMGPKRSLVKLFKTNPRSSLKEILVQSMGIKIVIDKKREIYFIDNVKFHIDQVKELGSFIEVEAIDKKNSIGEIRLLEQCEYYKKEFGIKDDDLINKSYSDLLMKKV